MNAFYGEKDVQIDVLFIFLEIKHQVKQQEPANVVQPLQCFVTSIKDFLKARGHEKPKITENIESSLKLLFFYIFNALTYISNYKDAQMKRKACIKDQQQNTLMSFQNLKICLNNQEEAFQTLQYNESLHLQYYAFCNIDNLSPFFRIHTLYLNNNLIEKLQNLQTLVQLRTLNLSYNRIKIFENLGNLINLYSLDLSNNFIESMPSEEMQGLKNLNNLKLKENRLTSFQGIKGLNQLSETLTYLDISGNENLEFNLLFYTELFSKLKVSVLGLGSTLFSRSATNYRKQVILSLKTLKFLDQRPVSPQERMLAQAWKEGGLQLQKEVRAQIKQKKVQKNNKIYAQMEERSQVAQEKRNRVFAKLTDKQTKKLKELLAKRNNMQEYELMKEEDKDLLNLKTEDLQKYLQLMRQAVKYMDLDKELGEGKVQLPKMLIQKQTKDAIFVYNVSQEQITLIAEKYYPEETRPIVAVNYDKPAEIRWTKEYNQLLTQAYAHAKANIELLVPLFNLQLYGFDQQTGRKLKRFQAEELLLHWTSMNEQQAKLQKRIEAYDELD